MPILCALNPLSSSLRARNSVDRVSGFERDALGVNEMLYQTELITHERYYID